MRGVILTLAFVILWPQVCRAEIIVLKCSFDKGGAIFFTRYSDGTPSRVGTKPGVGDKAQFHQDRFGAQVFVETNIDGTPITMTTIQRDLTAIHSRHVLTLDGSVVIPSQSKGRCQREALN